MEHARAWISTIDGQGRVNLAPYSFYNGVSEHPPMVYFAVTGTYGDTPTKHSRMNAEETGEFVVNMVAGTLSEKMNITTAMVAYGIDEMNLAGLTPEPSRYVKPPRVRMIITNAIDFCSLEREHSVRDFSTDDFSDSSV